MQVRAKTKRQSSSSKHDIPEKWKKLFDDHLPNYDPCAQADGYVFVAKDAEFAVEFIESCIKHAKGEKAGKPFILEPWEKAIVGCLFGWKGESTMLRRFRECLIYVPKKNGKTAFVAALLLLVMMTDHEFGAELYTAAASREQATLIFQHCVGMIRQESELSSRLEVFGGKGTNNVRSIIYDAEMSSYKCLSGDANTADGANVHFAGIDELHRHKTPELASVLQKSTAARSQPLVVYTTTADYNRESLCNDMLKIAKQVCANKGDKLKPGYLPSFLPVVYEAHKDDDWRRESTWKKANPNYGVTVHAPFFRTEIERCKSIPREINSFRRLHLNIVTDSDEGWLPSDLWEACSAPQKSPRDRICYAGLDMSSTTDLTALVLVCADGPVFDVWCRVWVPADNVHARSTRDGVDYQTWADAGLLHTTPQNVVDYDLVRKEINAIAQEFNIGGIAIDRWNATQLAVQLAGDGFNVEFFGQGYSSMSAPSKELEKLVSGRLLRHGGHPVLNWAAGNVMIEQDAAGNIKPSKKKSSERIDPIVALVMALGLATSQAETEAGFEWA